MNVLILFLVIDFQINRLSSLNSFLYTLVCTLNVVVEYQSGFRESVIMVFKVWKWRQNVNSNISRL